MIESDIQLEFDIAGPFLVQSSTGGEYGVDAAALRDVNGALVLTGSQVRGRIREALVEFQQIGKVSGDKITSWLGPQLPKEWGTVDPDQGLRPHNWHFTDFVAQLNVDNTLISRIQIESETGAVKRGALQVIESGLPIGQTVKFCSTVTLSGQGEDEIDEAVKWLKRAAAWVASFGAFRNVGFGAVKSVKSTVTAIRASRANLITANREPVSVLGTSTTTNLTSPSGDATEPSACTRRRYLRIEMEEPFCIGTRRRSLNTVESLRYIPGAVIKGAVAQVVKRIYGQTGTVDLMTLSGEQLPRLCKTFRHIRFLAAFPTSEDTAGRPVVSPLSLFMDSKDKLYDAAHIDGPFLVKNKDLVKAPCFAPDWKEAPAGWDSGWLNPHVELRIRTAIDSGRRRARDQFLFAQELVHPLAIDRDDSRIATGQRPKVIWRGEITLDESVTDPKAIWDELELLFDWAVFRIGKTKARARFSFDWDSRKSDYQSNLDSVDGRWVIVLQSPALLVDPRDLETEWTNGNDATRTLYEQVFLEISGGHLKLVNQFIDQSLHGGFLAHRCNPYDYKPFLVTEAGSCFVLEANGHADDAKTEIGSWLDNCLPLPNWATEFYGDNFTTNPFTPADGFGEIVVNLPRQVDQLKPSDDLIQRISCSQKGDAS
ncbi:MAG: hypothetical protein Tsb009_10910 [Planctomycetaceae bacterium]